MFKVKKKALARQKPIVVVHLLGLNKLYTLLVILWLFFEKQLNVQCGIGSISMLISQDIHNAASRAIEQLAMNSYNHFYNTLRLFGVLPYFPFTASETICNYYR